MYSLTVDDFQLPSETRYMARERLDKFIDEGRVVRANAEGTVVPIDETQEERYARLEKSWGRDAKARAHQLPLTSKDLRGPRR